MVVAGTTGLTGPTESRTIATQGGAVPRGRLPGADPGCSALNGGLPQRAMAWGPATTPLSCGVEDGELIHAITRPAIAHCAREDGVPGNRRANRIPSWGTGPKSRKPEGCYSRPFAACELGLRCWPAIALPTDSKARRGKRRGGSWLERVDSRRNIIFESASPRGGGGAEWGEGWVLRIHGGGGLANRDREKCLDGHLVRPIGDCGSKKTDSFIEIASERERAAVLI